MQEIGFDSKRHVLIIDADPMTLETLGTALQEEYHVHLAQKIPAADTVLDQKMIDLIILDMPLQTEHCLDFLDRLRKQSDIPVLLMSTTATRDMIIAGMRARANDYMDKPFTEGEFRVKVQGLLAHGPDPGHIADRVRQFVEEHFADDWAMESLAGALNLSVRTMREVFFRRYRRSVLKFLEEVRLREARELLDHTDLPIHDVARRVGFHDPHYFSRVFRQSSGISPRKFRVSKRQESGEKLLQPA